MRDSIVENKWSAVRDTLKETADNVLGYEDKKQPDWYSESADTIELALKERSECYQTWLATGQVGDHIRFAKARSRARRIVREAKYAWFRSKAEAAQNDRFSGKGAWKCIRDMQRGRRGLIPTRCITIRDEEGNPCTSTESQEERWRRHFSNVLNVRSKYSEEELDKARQRPIQTELAEEPSMEEIAKAVKKLKAGKAGGSSEILAEMVMAGCGSEEFRLRLVELITAAWRDQKVPTDWRDAIIVPIPKKGDLTSCDNWRGIVLLDVVGKVLEKIIQMRLQRVAEMELPESQCGFREGRGCSDMVFMVRQLVEKAYEHKSKVFLTFVDLKKAYDSVPRKGLWKALRKLGIPENVIVIIQSFHDNMSAQICCNGKLSDDISVGNGL